MLSKQFLKQIIFLFVFLVSPFIILSSQQSFAQADEIPTDANTIAEGDNLYKQNCKVCHNIGSQLIGPALANVYDRRDLPWIYAFVKNSAKLIASGDEQAVAVYNENNKLAMQAFDFFSDEEILSIVAYIKDQTDNPPVEVASGPAGGTAVQGNEPLPYLNVILIGTILLLGLLLVVLYLIVSALAKFIGQRDDISDEDKEFAAQTNPFKLFRNKAFLGIMVAIFTMAFAKAGIDSLYSIGVQQGYAPKQPIAYSHKVHSGDYKIDCNYCHTGVTKSKNANIPSPNICMNCHSSITTGTNTGTTEIDKIYAAIENDEPIEWVRVHNLPDLAYFNHSQHVVVGKLECKTCHGPIEEMEVVRQYSNLTMGWCINCHRDTELNTRGNGYYDKLVELHEQETNEPFTVEANGGIECAKCHY